MRLLFREKREEGIWNSFMRLIEIPMTFLRDYSTPPGDHEGWNRVRAAVIPATIVLAFNYLWGNIEFSAGWSQLGLQLGVYAIVPGALAGVFIMFKTKKY